MENSLVNINKLITAYKDGKSIKILNAIYDKKKDIIVKKNTIITEIETLKRIKKNNMFGVCAIIIDPPENNNKKIQYNVAEKNNIEKKFDEINEKQKEAKKKFNTAKKSIKNVLNNIKAQNGRFDYSDVENTVDDLVDFIKNTESSFSYLSKEIFSFDNYLHNHSINVCTIGVTILNRLNKNNKNITIPKNPTKIQQQQRADETKIIRYTDDEVKEIAKGFFMHDIGKILVPDKILNKPGKLTEEEYKEIKKHSYINGLKLLKKNNINNTFISNSVIYHHSPLYPSEKTGYPINKKANEITPYVHICKLADIYDALTSKRCYKDAISPLVIITRIFRSYANKGNKTLQDILLYFIKTIGIYPPHCIIYLKNGQKAYVIDSDGPIVIPFTNNRGETITKKNDPIKIPSSDKEELSINYNKQISSPLESYNILPEYLKKLYKS